MLIKRRNFLKGLLGTTAALAVPLPRVPVSPAPPAPALVLPEAPALVAPERRLWALDRTMMTPASGSALGDARLYIDGQWVATIREWRLDTTTGLWRGSTDVIRGVWDKA